MSELIITQAKEEQENSLVKHNTQHQRNDVDIYYSTIENENGTKLIISNYGAAVVSLFTKDKNGQLADIVLGYDNQIDYFFDQFYLGAIVGRYANRIAGDTVTINKTSYKLSVREGGYHLHGGYAGFNKKTFQTTSFQNDIGNGLILKYKSPHLEEGFPGELCLEVIYTLTHDDHWIVEYKATADRTTFINLTQHTYFNLSGQLDKSVDEHNLKINSSFYLPVTSLQVPTGDIATVWNTPFNFTTSKKIGEDINTPHEQLKLSNGYDHSWVLEQKHTDNLKHAATVQENKSGRRLDVFTTEPAIHLYTGNFLHNIAGKNNLKYNQRSGLCLETQHFPDAPNHAHFPSTLLERGDEFYSKTIFKFSVEA
jgi:aldose 1-epimerase